MKTTTPRVRKSPKITVRKNADNRYGYVSGRRVEMFLNESPWGPTAEENAREWLARCERLEVSEHAGFVADMYRGHRPDLK